MGMRSKLALRVTVGAVLLAIQLAASAAQLTQEQANEAMSKLPWQKGPGKAALGDKATVALPASTGFLPESSGSKFLEINGNLPAPGTSVLMANDWFAVFSFNPSGYIKDDEKLDADALLSSLKEAQVPANEERVKRGFPKMFNDGWVVAPHYDPQTKYLEWGVRLHTEGSPEPIINYTVRLLGRTGYESVILVSSPEMLDKNIADLKTSLKTFDFNSGEKYSEFRPGDHVAEFGLGALVLGGAAAAAVKTGLWKTVLVALAASWKLVAAAVLAGIAGIGKFFKRAKAK